MNKKTKGAIAAGAAALLLAGGAGSFALWSDSAELDGGTITAGSLTLSGGSAPVWKDKNNEVISLATHKVVPGETLTYTNTVTVGAVGKNLQATFGVAQGTNSGDLGPHLTLGTVTAKKDGTAVSAITEAAAGDVEVSFTVTFDEAADNATMDAEGVLGDVTLTLNQVDPTP